MADSLRSAQTELGEKHKCCRLGLAPVSRTDARVKQPLGLPGPLLGLLLFSNFPAWGTRPYPGLATSFLASYLTQPFRPRALVLVRENGS